MSRRGSAMALSLLARPPVSPAARPEWPISRRSQHSRSRCMPGAPRPDKLAPRRKVPTISAGVVEEP